MAFSDNAIGFYLEVADNLTPRLAKAEKAYGVFVKKLDSWNTKAYNSATRGFSGIAKTVGSAMKMLSGPKGGGRGTMKVSVEFNKASQKQLGLSVARAVATALRKATLSGQKGAFKIPRFAKGGIVGGRTPRNPGPPKDNIQALVSEGERIMSAKDAQKADAALGRMRDGKGQFLPKDAYKEVDRVGRSFEGFASKLHDLADANELGLDPDAPKKYVGELTKLEAVYGEFHRRVMKMTDLEKKRHIPQLKEMNSQLKSLRANGLKAQGPLEKLFSKVLGPVRFLAISEAMGNLQENFLEINNAMSNIGGALELEKTADGLVTNFLQANATMQKTRAELDLLQDAFVENNKIIPISVRDTANLSEAFQQLIELSLGDKKSFALYQSVGLLSQASGQAEAEIASLTRTLLDTKMTTESTASAYGTLVAMAKEMQLPVSRMTDAMRMAAETNREWLNALSPEESATAIMSMTKMAAAAEKVQAGAGDMVSDLLSGVSDPAKFKTLAGAFNTTAEGLRSMLASGDIESLFRSLGEMSPESMTKFAADMGLNAQMMPLLTTRSGELRDQLGKLSKVNVTASDSTRVMAEAIEGTRTTFQKMMNTAKEAVVETFPNLIQFFKDLNPLTLLSTVYLLSHFKVFSMLSKLKMPAMGKLGGLGKAGALLGKAGALLGGLGAAKIMLIAAAIAVLVGAIVYFRKEVSAFLSGAWSEFMRAMEPLWTTLEPVLSDISAGVGHVVRWLGLLFKGSNATADGLSNAADNGRVLGNILATVVKFALTPFVIGLQLFHGVASALGALLAGDFSGALDLMGGAVQRAWEWVYKLLGVDVSGSTFSESFDKMTAKWDSWVGDSAFVKWLSDWWGNANTVDITSGMNDTQKEKYRLADEMQARRRATGMSTGGIVTGGSGHNIDDVLAMLAKGEMVVPAKTTARLSEQARNPIANYPMPDVGSLRDSASGMTKDNRAVELLDAMLAVMKDQLTATRANAPSGDPSRPTRGSSALGRDIAHGRY